MNSRFQKSDLPYLGLTGLVWPALRWLAEQRITTAPEWAAKVASIPNALDWLLFGIALGVLACEPFRANSRTVMLWRIWHQLFELESIAVNQVGYVPPYREACAEIRFTREMGKAEIRVWGLVSNVRAPFLIQAESGKNLRKHELKKITLVGFSIHDDTIPYRFGNDDSGQRIEAQKVHRAVVEVRSGLRRQRETLTLVMRPISQQNNAEVIPDRGLYWWAEL